MFCANFASSFWTSLSLCSSVKPLSSLLKALYFLDNPLLALSISSKADLSLSSNASTRWTSISIAFLFCCTSSATSVSSSTRASTLNPPLAIKSSIWFILAKFSLRTCLPLFDWKGAIACLNKTGDFMVEPIIAPLTKDSARSSKSPTSLLPDIISKPFPASVARTSDPPS